ncbi:MAG: 50S ribosomal protein L10 [Clostridiales bacterium]|nr:50S ribosomal protein L10 [Clostridiales bacterium]
MANEKIIELKKQEVTKLAERFKKANIILLTDYRGINAEDVTKLRKDLGNVEAEYSVIKNNIIRRAFEEMGIKDFESELVGPTAVITCESDYLATSKVIYNFIKENDYYTLKAGMIEGAVKTKEEIFTLAQLPSREELLSKLAGVLLANISKLAVALDQVKQQKESGVEPEVKEEKVEAVEEVKAEEVKEEEKTEQE